MPLPKMSDDLTDDEDPLDGTEILQPLDMHLVEDEQSSPVVDAPSADDQT